MNPSFYVIYPSNDNVRIYINAIRVIAEENQRTQVHITVRGPYKKRLSELKEKEYSSLIQGEKLIVNGIGNFFELNQNTIFFECEENLKLKKIWKKTSYMEYKPHITIYDGKDRDFAHDLYNVLEKNFKAFPFIVNELSWLEPKDKEKLELFHLKTVIDFGSLSNELGQSLNLSIIEKLSNVERLNFISILSEKLYKSESIK